jgi:hypothetical protein
MSWHPRVAKSRKAVRKAGHKTKAGPLTKPYFIRFLVFPKFAAERPFLSANFPIEKRSPSQYACRVPAVRECGTARRIWVLNLVHRIIKYAHGCFWRKADVRQNTYVGWVPVIGSRLIYRSLRRRVLRQSIFVL